jgi:ribosomal protein S18 acetylase RimI-like enzyme
MPWFGLSTKDDTSSNGSDDDDDEPTDDLDKDLELGNVNNRSSPDTIIPSLDLSRSYKSNNNTPPCLSDWQADHRKQIPPKLQFRSLQPHDRQRIQQLHEQWFPVTYSNEFYEDLVKNHRLATSGDPLYTCVATLPNTTTATTTTSTNNIMMDGDGYKYCQSTQQQQRQRRPNQYNNSQHHHNATALSPKNNNGHHDDEIIVGCVVGAFVHPSRLNPTTQQLLVPNSQLHTKLFYIMTLGTVEEYRGYGVATALVQKCMEMVEKDCSCGALYLHVIPCNRAAIQFYEKLGFYRVCSIDNYYHIDNQHYDCFLYAKYYHGMFIYVMVRVDDRLCCVVLCCDDPGYVPIYILIFCAQFLTCSSFFHSFLPSFLHSFIHVKKILTCRQSRSSNTLQDIFKGYILPLAASPGASCFVLVSFQLARALATYGIMARGEGRFVDDGKHAFLIKKKRSDRPRTFILASKKRYCTVTRYIWRFRFANSLSSCQHAPGLPNESIPPFQGFPVRYLHASF